jgi:glycosyltransferase involved in cell wall biosynthesis
MNTSAVVRALEEGHIDFAERLVLDSIKDDISERDNKKTKIILSYIKSRKRILLLQNDGILSDRGSKLSDEDCSTDEVGTPNETAKLNRLQFSNEDEIQAKNLIDVEYYKRVNWWDIAKYRIDPVEHYMEFGWQEGRKPNSWFDTRYYTTTHLSEAKDINPLIHFAKIGKFLRLPPNSGVLYSNEFKVFAEEVLKIDSSSAVSFVEDINIDTQERLERGELCRQIAKAATIEPLIRHGILDSREIRRPFISNLNILNMMSAMSRLQHETGYKKYDAILFVPWIKMGGSDKVSGLLYESLVRRYESDKVLLVTTEKDHEKINQFYPSNVNLLNIGQMKLLLNSSDLNRLIFEFLRSISPQVVVNINSNVCWQIFDEYGSFLSEMMRTVAFLFCDDINIVGDEDGYPSRYFHRVYDKLSAIGTDSHYLKTKLERRFGFKESDKVKIRVIPMPVDKKITAYKRDRERSQRKEIKIFWAGRFDFQKRIDIVFLIAERRPEWKFYIWGKPVLDDFKFNFNAAPQNVIYQGSYSDITSLPLNECDAWLYTSMWDGVPNLLLEVAGLGVPIIGTNKCGGKEVINDETSLIIENIEDVNAYVSAIEAVIRETERYETMAARLRIKLIQSRTVDAFEECIDSLFGKT